MVVIVSGKIFLGCAWWGPRSPSPASAWFPRTHNHYLQVIGECRVYLPSGSAIGVGIVLLFPISLCNQQGCKNSYSSLHVKAQPCCFYRKQFKTQRSCCKYGLFLLRLRPGRCGLGFVFQNISLVRVKSLLCAPGRTRAFSSSEKFTTWSS